MDHLLSREIITVNTRDTVVDSQELSLIWFCQVRALFVLIYRTIFCVEKLLIYLYKNTGELKEGRTSAFFK